MSTETKNRTNIFAVLKNMFSSEPDIEEYDEKLPEELSSVLKSLEEREKRAEQPIHTENNSSKKGGFTKKIDPKTEEAMRRMHNQVKENSIDDRERE